MATATKVPPHSEEAEKSVLGAILMDRDAVVAVVEFLRPEHFYVEKHKSIFEAVMNLYQEREPIDVVSVSERIKKQKDLTLVGAGYLAELVNGVPTAAHAEHYAHLVKDMYTKRMLIVAASKISDMAFDDAGDVRQILDNAESTVFSLSQQNLRQVFVPVKEILAESFDRLDELHKSAGSLRGVPTGFKELDNILAGMQDSNLLILAARPGMGKCVAGDTLVIDPQTGRRNTIKHIVEQKSGVVLGLNNNLKFEEVNPSNFVDDGIKPVWEITTGLGNKLKATCVHPLLTLSGWKRVEELQAGDRIATPRELPYFGQEVWSEERVKLLAYMLGDGSTANLTPRFTNSDTRLLNDFKDSLADFSGVSAHLEKSGVNKVPTLSICGNGQFLKMQKMKFAERFKKLIADFNISQAKISAMLGVTPAMVSMVASGQSVFGNSHISKLNELGFDLPKIYAKSFTEWLKQLEIWDVKSPVKEIPEVVFTLKKELIAIFLNRLFACEGSVIISKQNQVRISFSSSSEKLAEGVKHLLLRFGILTKMRTKKIKYQGQIRLSYELEIMGREPILNFASNIGIFGKEEKLNMAIQIVKKVPEMQFSKDTIPVEVWELVKKEMGGMSLADLNSKLGNSRSKNIHFGKRNPRRETIYQISRALNSRGLEIIATSELFWDEIKKIEHVGSEPVYDLTVDNLHNFVAGDIVVHNTALALNMGLHSALKHKMPVGFFSLEMSREELIDRLLVSHAEIDAWKMKTGRLDDSELNKLSEAMGELYEAPLYIDDTPGMSILEMRTKARRLQSEHGLKLIVVDYLQLARPVRNLDNRVQEVAEVSQGLKNLARELKIPVLALSQLSRNVESRGVKRPQLSDLRESGAIEQDADVVMFLWRENDDDLENVKIDIAKHRNGAMGSIPLRFKGDKIKFYGVEGKREEQ